MGVSRDILPPFGDWPLLDGLWTAAANRRLELEHLWVTHPPQGRVVAPVIIAGPYRTGTTYLHRALAEAIPERRTLLGWEASIPLHPADSCLPARMSDPRCKEHAEVLDLLYGGVEGLRELQDERADAASECVQAMAMTDTTGLWPAIADCPGYVSWLVSEEAKVASLGSYAFYEKCLNHLSPEPTLWLLKAPMHSLFLWTILEQWPDATVIWMKRDLGAMGSSCLKLFTQLRRLSIPNYSWDEGHEWLRRYLIEHRNRCLAAEGTYPDNVFSFNWIDLKKRPFETVQEIAALIRERTPEVAAHTH